MATTVQQLHRRIERYAASLEPQLAIRVMAAYTAIRNSISVPQLVKLLGEASPERIASMLVATEDLLPHFKPFGSAVTQGSIDAAKRFTLDLPVDIKKVLGGTAASRTFGVLNPHIITGLRKLDSRVMLNLTGGVRDTFMDVMVRGMEAGDPHAKIARKLRDTLGLARNQAQAVDNFEKMLKEGDRDALSRVWRDKRFDRTLQRALGKDGTGLTKAQIDKMTAAYRKRAIASNAATHARTAALDAQRLGQKLNWEDAIAQGTVKRSEVWKRWSDTGDDRVRPEHIEASGEEVPFDEPFSVTGEDIPGESSFSCRCLAIYFRKPRRKDWKPKEAGLLKPGHRVVRGPGVLPAVPVVPTPQPAAGGANAYFNSVDLTGIPPSALAEVDDALDAVLGKHGVPKMDTLKLVDSIPGSAEFGEVPAIAAYTEEVSLRAGVATTTREMVFDRRMMTRARELAATEREVWATRQARALARKEAGNVPIHLQQKIENTLSAPSWSVVGTSERPLFSTVAHESGHALLSSYGEKYAGDATWMRLLRDKYNIRAGSPKMYQISEYAASETEELFAEITALVADGRSALVPDDLMAAYNEMLGLIAKGEGI